MSLEPVTGFNIINNILGIFSKVGIRIQIPIDAPGLNVISRMILARELNMYFQRIRREDEALNIHKLHEYNEEQIDAICFKRGIEIDKQSLDQKIQKLKLWLSISNQRNVPHSLLLYTRVNDYTNDLFEISDDEDDNEILRRVSTIYYFILLIQFLI